MKKLSYALVFILLFMFSGHVKADTSITYQAHVQNIGWQNATSGVAGTTGQALRMEAFKINVNSDLSGQVIYKSHVQNIGWQDSVGGGSITGTTGQALRMEAISIYLTDELEASYDIYYRTHIQDYGWLGWAKNGEYSGSAGYGKRMEALEIKLVPKSEEFTGSRNDYFIEKPATVTYNGHVQNIGWQSAVENGSTIGTTGNGLRLEALNISFSSTRYSGYITYQTHIQNLGWSMWSSNGDMTGTTGRGLRIEGIRIILEGEIANYYDVYYRAHVQNIGWQDWVKNGDLAGTTGQALRMEALEIKLVLKNGVELGTSGNENQSARFLWGYNNGVRILSNTATGLIGVDVQKIIDVSEHQGTIDWNQVATNGDIDGVILRVGWGSFQEDGEFARNISELKRLNIPYGIYIFSYAENRAEGIAEANGVIDAMNRYSLSPTLGVYLDLENWSIPGGSSTDSISPSGYDEIIGGFYDTMNTAGVQPGVYTYVNFAYNKLSENARSKITWIAQYNSYLEYGEPFKIWQYSSSGSVPGINTRVDMNVLFN